MKSVQWNLPRGVVVVIYEDWGGKKRQLALWGKGQYRSVKGFELRGKASSWAWFYLGTSANPPNDRVLGGLSERPLHATEVTDAVDPDSMQLRQHPKFRGHLLPITNVTRKSEGEPQPMAGAIALDNKMSSLRWKLPSGVLVVFYDEHDGDGQQIAIWGSGEITVLGVFDNKATGWRWVNVD